MSRRSASLAAILAVLLHALWPLIAQAKPENSLLTSVCTNDGSTHYVAIDLGDSPLDQRSAVQHEHCALCVFGAERLVVPSAQLPSLPAADSPRLSLAPYSAVLPAFQFAPPAQPRAPPLFS